ncbi:adhesion G protein-coupled receptor L3-like [Pecten maximus]|uniref:adhesion G protein-coupled receptor L3-like n=1 Tax=Pecten maximus TaxID=6579 RepID=UPI00145843C5|nr:adhesion G protein-coupled receptor L3-like [Pecten maximus]
MKSVLCIVVISLSLIPVTISGSMRCPKPWVKVHRACYKFVKEYETWDSATAKCLEDGANLASIGSMAEKIKMMRHLTQIIRKPNQDRWWVGLRHNESRSVWRWSDGAELNRRVTPWSPGEPNNGRGDEFCAEFQIRGKLNDVQCSTQRFYICEWNQITPPPTPSTTSVPLTTTRKQATTTTTSATTSTTTVRTLTKVTPAKHPKTNTTMDSIGSTAQVQTSEGPITTETTDPHIMSFSRTKPFVRVTPSTVLNILEENDSTEMDEHIPSTTSLDIDYPINHERISTKTPAPRYQTHCPRRVAYGLVWPETEQGESRTIPCEKGSGTATWHCGRNPVRWTKKPDTEACASKQFKDLMLRVSPGKADTSPIVTKEAINIAKDLVRKTDASNPMTAADLSISTTILRKVTNVRPKTKSEAVTLVKELVKAGSNLVANTEKSADVRQPDKRRAAASILSAMEDSTTSMAEAIQVPTVIKTSTEKLELELYVVNTSDVSDALICGADEGKDSKEDGDKVSIPASVLQQLSTDDLSKVVFMKHSDIGEFLVSENESNATPQIASDVISVSIGHADTSKLIEPVTFSLKLLQQIDDEYVPLCSFWNFSEGESGSWSQIGCDVTAKTPYRVTCQCNHLTSFAILLDVSGVAMSSHHHSILRYITFVGCIISLLSLFTSWLTFNCLSPLQGERNSIHKNLVFSLFAAELTFLVGVDQTDKQVSCAVIALLLHFFFLSAFTWMLMEAVQIVIMLVQVFDTAKSNLKYFYLAGYGIPIVIVATTAGIDFTAYGTPQYCWLTTDRYFIWSFAGPVAAVLLVNAGILTYAMSTVCRHSDYVFSREKANAGNFKAWIQGAFALEVLLGLTWVFGYFFLNEETVTMAYIFTVLNSLQGLFIFIFHCLLNKKVRNEYKKLVHISKKAPALSSTKSASLRKNDGSYAL